MSSNQKQLSLSPFIATFAALTSSILPREAFASVGAGSGLEYEVTFNKFVTSLTGPWAFTVAIVCVIVFAWKAIQHGADLGGSTLAFLGPAFICTLLLGAKKLMSFFGQGAMLTASSTFSNPSDMLSRILAAVLILAGLLIGASALRKSYRRQRCAGGTVEQPSPER